MAKGKWSFSDKLAVALACLAAVMAFALPWMERTPGWALFTIIAMAAFVVYPVLHFCPHWKSRIPCLIVVWGVIGWFGDRIWPHSQPAAAASVPAPIQQQPKTEQPIAMAKEPDTQKTTTKPESTKHRAATKPEGAMANSQAAKQQQCQTGSICNQDSSVSGSQTVNNNDSPIVLQNNGQIGSVTQSGNTVITADDVSKGKSIR